MSRFFFQSTGYFIVWLPSGWSIFDPAAAGFSVSDFRTAPPSFSPILQRHHYIQLPPARLLQWPIGLISSTSTSSLKRDRTGCRHHIVTKWCRLAFYWINWRLNAKINPNCVFNNRWLLWIVSFGKKKKFSLYQIALHFISVQFHGLRAWMHVCVHVWMYSVCGWVCAWRSYLRYCSSARLDSDYKRNHFSVGVFKPM